MTTFQTRGGLRSPNVAPAISFARPKDQVDYHVPIGLCEDYAAESRCMDVVRRDLDVCRAAGAGVLRVSLPWESIELRPGDYQLGFWDDLIRTAVVEQGIRLIPYVCYGPRWACGGRSDTFWKRPPRRPADFGRVMRMLAARYRQEISTWELWNEPGNRDFWTGNLAEYAALVQAGSLGVRHGNAEARVVLGGIAHDLDFLEKLLAGYDVSRHVDIINLHNYFETWSPTATEGITGYVERAAEIVRKHGDDQPLWMAEVGYSSHRQGTKVSDFYRARYDYEHTPYYQAVQLVKTLTLLLATEKLSLVAWYEIKDLPATTEVIGDVNNRYLGIRGVNYAMKPAALALGFFDRVFSRKSRCIDDQLELKVFRGPRPEAHAFRLADGSMVAVAWLRTNDGQSSSGNGKLLVDERRSDFELVLPGGRESGPVTVYDAVGRALSCGTATSTDLRTHLCDMHLKGGDLLVARVGVGR